MDPQRRLFLRGRPAVKQAPPVPRPPWALAETEFLTSCTRCDACIQACPESILFKGDGGFPEVRFSRAGCTTCGRCVEVCQDHALLRNTDQPPWDWRADISPACLALKKVECRVCGEICDTGAIRFTPTLGGVSCPTLDASRCNGCGTCLAPCPTQAITLKMPTP